MKIAIAAAGAAGITAVFLGSSFAPIAPVIVIFGALAGSKMLMQEEKNALIDELEVELKVIEKEIQNCESENKPKKLRGCFAGISFEIIGMMRKAESKRDRRVISVCI